MDSSDELIAVTVVIAQGPSLAGAGLKNSCHRLSILRLICHKIGCRHDIQLSVLHASHDCNEILSSADKS